MFFRILYEIYCKQYNKEFDINLFEPLVHQFINTCEQKIVKHILYVRIQTIIFISDDI